ALAAVPRDGTPSPRDPVGPFVGANTNPAPGPAPVKEKADPKELEAKDLEALRGEWRAVKMETDQKAVTEREVASIRAFVEGNHLRMRSEEEHWQIEFEIALVPTEKPKHINRYPLGKGGKPDPTKVEFGIYELNGDSFKLCVPHSANESKKV